jgi:hypothetical protein
MVRNGRFRVTLGLTLGACLAFLAFLLARPVGDGVVKLVANLAQLLAPVLAASAGSWAVGQATWVWYEHLVRRELPFRPWPTSATWRPSPWPRRPCWPSRAGPNGPPSRCGRCWTGL